LLDPPELPLPGWFTNVEATALGTHIRNKLFGTVTVGPRTDVVHVPGADLDWTVAPRFDIGYRLPDGCGELLVSYYFVTTDGQSDTLTPLGPGSMKSRLDINEVDLVYATREITVIPPWDMRWKVGVRGLNVFFDGASNQSATPAVLPGGFIGQQAANDFLGAGPLIGLELTCATGVPKLTLWGHAEGAYLWGHLHQKFTETLAAFGAVPVTGILDATTTQGVGVAQGQLGLRWTPNGCNGSRFFVGYEFDYYAQVGRNDNTGSMADIFQHGLFVRGEFNF
jgi:hypothetical protein